MSILTPLVVGQDYRLRPPATEADVHLVRDSWRRSYSGPWSDFASSPNFDAFMRGQTTAMDLALASSEVVIACAPDCDDQILGWICFRRAEPVLHYVFVKSDFRGHGLGSALFDAAFGREAQRVYTTHVHTVTVRTQLVARKRRDGRLDRDRPVPTWRLFGRRLCFQPWLIFAPAAGSA
jgi:GNAT superfamily N-acetyltransferase